MTTRAELLNEKLTQYQHNDKRFRVAHETEKILPAGIYHIKEDMSGIFFEEATMSNDTILSATDERLDGIIEEATSFWGKKGKYSKLGLKHKRGILLESKPGTGKSILMQRLATDAVEKGAIVFTTSDPRMLTAGLRQIRAVEKDRNIMAMMDDMDSLLHAESSLISLLDGENSVDNVLFIASTNYLERFPKRLTRPGRFDTIVHIDNPPKEVRAAYFKDKVPEADDKETNAFVKASNDFSFAEMKELLVSTKVYDRKVDREATRIKKANEATVDSGAPAAYFIISAKDKAEAMKVAKALASIVVSSEQINDRVYATMLGDKSKGQQLINHVLKKAGLNNEAIEMTRADMIEQKLGETPSLPVTEAKDTFKDVVAKLADGKNDPAATRASLVQYLKDAYPAAIKDYVALLKKELKGLKFVTSKGSLGTDITVVAGRHTLGTTGIYVSKGSGIVIGGSTSGLFLSGSINANITKSFFGSHPEYDMYAIQVALLK